MAGVVIIPDFDAAALLVTIELSSDKTNIFFLAILVQAKELSIYPLTPSGDIHHRIGYYFTGSNVFLKKIHKK
jgi:hypothetical protein